MLIKESDLHSNFLFPNLHVCSWKRFLILTLLPAVFLNFPALPQSNIQ